jgi:hypothetical protein
LSHVCGQPFHSQKAEVAVRWVAVYVETPISSATEFLGAFA